MRRLSSLDWDKQMMNARTPAAAGAARAGQEEVCWSGEPSSWFFERRLSANNKKIERLRVLLEVSPSALGLSYCTRTTVGFCPTLTPRGGRNRKSTTDPTLQSFPSCCSRDLAVRRVPTKYKRAVKRVRDVVGHGASDFPSPVFQPNRGKCRQTRV